MLTTPKYRLLQSLYLGFVILDDTIFVFLIVALFLDVAPKDIFEIFEERWLVLLVIAFEIFYDILQLVVQIWLISRVSIWIVVMLYISYAMAFTFLDINDEPIGSAWDCQLYVLFFSRVGAFFMETLVDFCIDLEVDRDLSTEQRVKREIPADQGSGSVEAIESRPMINELPYIFRCLKHEENVAHPIILPGDWKYRGSISAWTWNDTKLCDQEITTKPLDCGCIQCICGFLCGYGCKCKAQWYHIVLVPLAAFVALILILLLMIPVTLLTVLKKCCGCCCCRKGLTNNSICGEFGRKDV